MFGVETVGLLEGEVASGEHDTIKSVNTLAKIVDLLVLTKASGGFSVFIPSSLINSVVIRTLCDRQGPS